MTRAIGAACLTWLGLTACFHADDERPALLEDMPGLTLIVGASPVRAVVEIDFRMDWCVILHDSFSAKINGAALPIENPGGGDESSCDRPRLRLDMPPTAAISTLSIEDDSVRVDIGLGDLVAPRTMQLVPEGPWIFDVGQTVTARYSPMADLYAPTARLVLSYPASVGTLPELRNIPFTASGDELTFVVPDHVGPGQLELRTPPPGPEPWPCPPLTCLRVDPPRFAQPIEIRRP